MIFTSRFRIQTLRVNGAFTEVSQVKKFEISEEEYEKRNDSVVVEDVGGLVKRGIVKFVGLTKFKPGHWAGIEYDEPLGKHDGSVGGEKYFDAKPKYGAFARPNKMEVGDFSEEDLFGDDDEEM
ncbi:UNVERIFIED_CONTAM: hypothetical protein HDU68_003238 [Siphonaria sp. JEL0065]|nr:hypothetical protein HDU68_003238 [Siphonaria sp. JEL0065]